MHGLARHGHIGRRVVGGPEQSQRLFWPGRQCPDGAGDPVGLDLVRADRPQWLFQLTRPGLLSAVPVADPDRRVGRGVVAARRAVGVADLVAGRARDRPPAHRARARRRGRGSDRSSARVHTNGGVLLGGLHRIAVSRAVGGYVPRGQARAMAARRSARRSGRGDSSHRRSARHPVRSVVLGAAQASSAGDPAGTRACGAQARAARSCGGC